MIDIHSSPRCGPCTPYERAFTQHTAHLAKALQLKVRRSLAILVRSSPILTIDGCEVPVRVETIFEQEAPFQWRFRYQIVEADPPGPAAERSLVARWARRRREQFTDPDGPRMTPVIQTIGSVLGNGQEGRDYVLLNHMPALVAGQD